MDKQIGALTSLRGIAALIVVVHHFAYYTLPQTGKFLSSYSHFFKNGYLCVDFFFILSGFIMAHVYANDFYGQVDKSDYWKYLRARFARIYPLHLFTLLVLVGLELIKMIAGSGHAFIGKFNLTALVANVFLLQAFDLSCPPLFWCGTYWNEPAWSISVEFVIYALFPFILYFILRLNPRSDLIAYVGTLIALFLLIKFTRGNLDSIIGLPSIARCSMESSLGIITYKIYQRINYQNRAIPIAVTAIAMVWILGVMHSWNDKYRGIHDWLILPACSLLILAVSNQSTRTSAKILNSKILIYLGTISYSIYMVHWCLSELLKTFWLSRLDSTFGRGLSLMQCSIACGASEAIGLTLFLLTTIATAAMTYKFIEVPMRTYLKSNRRLPT
jgi:peptidoglycan/LPS O-acetylase OafA/YrhL